MTTIGLTTRDVARELARRYSTMTHDELDVLEGILIPRKVQKGELLLKEGEVCPKHRRKGSHGLEIFQRCYCGEGLSCRIQKDHHQASNSSRLHTCQRH